MVHKRLNTFLYGLISEFRTDFPTRRPISHVLSLSACVQSSFLIRSPDLSGTALTGGSTNSFLQ